MDKQDESYLDNLLLEYGKEPSSRNDGRKDNQKEKSKTDLLLDELEKEFDMNELDDDFLAGNDLTPFSTRKQEPKSEETALSDNQEEVPVLQEEEEVPSYEEVTPEEISTPEENLTPEELSAKESAVLEETFEQAPLEEGFSSPEEELPEIDESYIDELLGDIGSEDLFSENNEAIQIDDSAVDFEASTLAPPDIEDDFEAEEGTKKGKKKKKKTSSQKGGIGQFFKKLFSNIPLTEEEINALPSPEEELAQIKDKKEQARLKKEEKKAKAAEAKKVKAEEAKKKAADNKAKKKAKEDAKKEAKKNAELKRLRAEAALPPEGKINKAGAFIVIIAFLLFGAMVIFGAGALSYDMNIAGAKFKFEKHDYNGAFNKIRGMDVKDKDMDISNKIQTVMFVNKQLNSYNNYYNMGNYANALDSLVKGLYRYDKYIAYATQIGIQSDLNYIREQIMTELDETYSMSERDALVLMGIIDKKEYSENVYKLSAKVSVKPEKMEEEEKEFVP